MTRWRPDTCACVLDVLDWDTAQGRTISTCPHHAGLADDAHLAVVYRGENFVKNMALTDLALAAPALFWTAAEARAQTEARLLAALGTVTARQRQLVQALSDEGLAGAAESIGVRPVSAGTPRPGVQVTWRFLDGPPGSARVLELACPQLAPAERDAVRAAVLRHGPGRVEIR